jgi:hypothetical protein
MVVPTLDDTAAARNQNLVSTTQSQPLFFGRSGGAIWCSRFASVARNRLYKAIQSRCCYAAHCAVAPIAPIPNLRGGGTPPVMWRCVPKKSSQEKTQTRTWAASCYGDGLGGGTLGRHVLTETP